MVRVFIFKLIIASFVLILLSGCSDNPAIRARYIAERLYFQAERASRDAQLGSRENFNREIKELNQNYKNTLELCYTALSDFSSNQHPTETRELSNIAFKSATRLSQLSFVSGNYNQCVAELEKLLLKVRLDTRAQISAYLNLGKSLQAAGKWDSALTVYQTTVDRFYPPMNSNGKTIRSLFTLPSLIYEVYSGVGDTTSAVKQFDRAEKYYRSLIEKYPNTEMTVGSHARLTGLYEKVGRWKDAMEELSQVTDSLGNPTLPARLRIADIQSARLRQHDPALAEYDLLIDELQGSDTMLVANILYKKGLVLLEKKQYSKAREVLIELKKRFRPFFANVPTAQYAIARAFDLQGKWDRAETEYRYVIKNYPGTPQSMSTYLYLAQKFTELGRNLESERVLNEAKENFKQLVIDKKGTFIEALALSYQAELYRRGDNWPKTIEILSTIFDRFPTEEIGYRSMLTAAVIYKTKLNNSKAADSLIVEMKKKLTAIDDKPNL